MLKLFVLSFLAVYIRIFYESSLFVLFIKFKLLLTEVVKNSIEIK